MDTYEEGDDGMDYSNAAGSQELGNTLQGGRQEKRQHSPELDCGERKKCCHSLESPSLRLYRLYNLARVCLYHISK